jgi:hypothetical protein
MVLSKKRKDGAAGKTGKKESRYIRMVRTVFNVCKRQCIPLYSSKFSRKDFTLWQHIALIVLMQRVRKSYREYVDDYLTTTEGLLSALGLVKIPHFTTIEKFLLRVPGALLEKVIGGFIGLTRIRSQVLAADSSGFSSDHASHYYALRIK